LDGRPYSLNAARALEKKLYENNIGRFFWFDFIISECVTFGVSFVLHLLVDIYERQATGVLISYSWFHTGEKRFLDPSLNPNPLISRHENLQI
jgi:hypothetical protein